MMAKPRWHHMLVESQRYALKAVDEWNMSAGSYSDFVTHMHRAWHYLLHAQFHRDKADYHYRDPKSGHCIKVDDEPKAWALEDCVKHRYPQTNDPVRLNLELFIKLRNKIEHRYEHGLKIATGGKAQALVVNYEAEITDQFGLAYSLADRLRFPVFLQAITAAGAEYMRKAASKLPRHTRDIVAKYEAALDQSVLDDLRYDYRIRLVPIVGPKTEADLAVDFVRLDELSEDERRIMTEAGRTGTVIVRDRQVEVAAKGKLRPMQVVELIQQQVPFVFTIATHTEMWRQMKVRPATGASDPYQTDGRYCVYDEPFGTYVYTSAWVKRILKDIGTVEKYRSFFGHGPSMAVSQLADQARNESAQGETAEDRSA